MTALQCRNVDRAPILIPDEPNIYTCPIPLHIDIGLANDIRELTLSRVVRLMDGNIGKVVQENVKRIETAIKSADESIKLLAKQIKTDKEKLQNYKREMKKDKDIDLRSINRRNAKWHTEEERTFVDAVT